MIVWNGEIERRKAKDRMNRWADERMKSKMNSWDVDMYAQIGPYIGWITMEREEGCTRGTNRICWRIEVVYVSIDCHCAVPPLPPPPPYLPPLLLLHPFTSYLFSLRCFDHALNVLLQRDFNRRLGDESVARRCRSSVACGHHCIIVHAAALDLPLPCHRFTSLGLAPVDQWVYMSPCLAIRRTLIAWDDTRMELYAVYTGVPRASDDVTWCLTGCHLINCLNVLRHSNR